jgi:formate dehydrogenase gamma subunit
LDTTDSRKSRTSQNGRRLRTLLPLTLVLAQPAYAEDAKRDNKACLECHGEGVDARYRVKASHLAASPHSEANGVSCVGCHTRAAEVKEIAEHGKLGKASCDGCHEASKQIARSMHAKKAEATPTCAQCHGGGHEIRKMSDPASPVHRTRQVKTCGACHEGPMLQNYLRSVHGHRLEQGKSDGPTCSTCHGGHTVGRADIEHNPAFKSQLVETCGRCHSKVATSYGESVHGTALRKGVLGSASCADCHRSHEILPPSDPRSAVHPTKVVRDCAKCHANERLIRQRHLPSDVVSTFEASYHGRAGELGSTRVANCSSCHENHAIFRASDLRSSVHPQNLQRSCGKCHPGATKNFIRGKIHVAGERQQNYWAWFVRTTYIWLIVVLIGGMVLHNLLDYLRKTVLRLRRQRAHPAVMRMTLQERVMHVLLLSSFLTLAYTGFALVFPTAWWVAPLNWVSSSEQFRKLLHRGAGILMTLIAIQHLWFLFLTARGREQRRSFLPRLRDVRELWQNVLFYLGRRRSRPSFARFSYIEKAEYWALVWGTVVMIATGFILWFEQTALRYMPRWLWEVFLVMHRFEAILAVLAIVVWHFYYVFINPDEAPMALTWISGRMTHEELALLHPDEFAQLPREQRAAAERAPEAEPSERAKAG